MRPSRNCFGGLRYLSGGARWRRQRRFATPGATLVSIPWKDCHPWWIKIWFSVWTDPRSSRASQCSKPFANLPSNAGWIATITRRAHAAYCLVLAEEGNPELSPVDRSRWLTQCDAEMDNFRSALDWLF